MTEPNQAVRAAVSAVRDHFAGKPVEAIPDGTGGAHVIVSEIEVGTIYSPPTTWLGFHIGAAYPHADVYPHYVGPITRLDNASHGEAIQSVTWQNRPALQLSRRSNGWNPSTDNAALKAEKVITWLLSR